MAETLQDFELARTERLWDATSLWCANRRDGGIYLFGYHAEMSLKLAYFRLLGESLAYPIDAAVLRTAVAAAALLGVRTPHDGFHSLRFWRDAIIAQRRARGRALPPPLDIEFHAHVEVLAARWDVAMRYRAPTATSQDVESSAIAAEWIDRNCNLLWT